MKTLNITTEQNLSIQNYKRFGIDVEVLEDDTIKITQSRLVNGIILNQKELHERAREIFSDKEYKIIPVAFSLQVDDITEDWIESKMKEFGIKRNDLVKQLAIDKSYLSLLFADNSNKRKIQLSKPMKATFFYYFLSYELSQDLREQLNNNSDAEYSACIINNKKLSDNIVVTPMKISFPESINYLKRREGKISRRSQSERSCRGGKSARLKKKAFVTKLKRRNNES